MIQVCPYDELAALAVMRALDPADMLEARHVRGPGLTHARLFAEWHAAQPGAVLSLVVKSAGGRPVALVMLANTGQWGVAQAALLAADHHLWRRELMATALRIRRRIGAYCRDTGIRRIEVRCWTDHPRAGALLRLCGFRIEATMPGFGLGGDQTFQQHAWTAETGG